MTSKALVQAALAGKPVPRVPTGPLAVHFCARHAGVSLRHYSTDAAALADAVVRYHARFRPDAVWISADTWVSAEAMGASIDAVDDEQPLGGVGAPRIRTAADIDRIPAPDVRGPGRYPMMLEALRRVVAAIGSEVFVVACFDQYPFSLASALMGIEAIMLKAVEDPPFVNALMDRCEEYVLSYARALGEAGADLLSGGDSPAGLLGPRLYEALALPAERRVIAAMKATLRPPVSLHICGDTTPILQQMATSGADVLEIDHAMDLALACRTVGPDVGLWGNIDPVHVLAQGTPTEVEAAARSALRSVKTAGHSRFVLSSGCTLAVETPPENLDAFLSSPL